MPQTKRKLPKTFGQVNYSDGSPSREIEEQEEDWETTGQEEMSQLHEKCREKRENQVSIVGVRDHLNRIYALVEVCQFALASSEWKGQQYCQQIVCEVLCDYVAPEIKNAEEELGYL